MKKTFCFIFCLNRGLPSRLWKGTALLLCMCTALQLAAAETDVYPMIDSQAGQQAGRKITGVVTDEKGEPVAGVNVFVKGTTTGIITGADGEYELTVPPGSVLVFSFVGFVSSEVTVTGQSTVNVTLVEDAKQLEEVVVTALGIKKEAKSLSYTAANVKGEDLSGAHETNVANALSGKVAGVFVNRPASGAAGSAKVLIRGNNSLRTNSQPLYVVDGIPIDNSSSDASNQWGGYDYGDGISNLNPNDIETMSVLKGPNATALYGERGGNGVILITTKSGARKKGVGVNYSSDFSAGHALVVPDFQNVYGVGYNGNFTHFLGSDGKNYSMKDAIANNIPGLPRAASGRDQTARGSWGARMQGQQYVDAYGTVRTFDPQPNTYDFFNTEENYVNDLSIDGGTDKLQYRFSANNTHNNGYFPSNKLNRNNFNLKVSADITDKIRFEGMANYIKQNVVNRPKLADSNTNPAYLFISMPRSLSLESLSDYAWTEETIAKQLGFTASTLFPGMEKGYATNSSTGNPYWTVNNEHNEDERDRIIGYFKLTYSIFPWLRVTAKTGTDYYSENKILWTAYGTWSSQNKHGDYREYTRRVRETNSDILLSSNFKIKEDWDVSLNAGGNQMRYFSRLIGSRGYEYIEPGLEVINNIKTLQYDFGLSEKAINSVYGSGQLGFRNFLYVDVSGRNDWSSTLPVQNGSYFYPSAGVSLLVPEAFNLNWDRLNFFKIRGSIAQAGSSGDPYALVGTYGIDSNKQNGVALGSYTGTVVDPNIKNELTTSYEGGFDLNLFNNRLALNVTLYHASTRNQILSVAIPASTTFSSRRVNAGEIQNKGVEVMLSGTPVRTSSGFAWESTFNFSRNRNMVVSLVEGSDTYVLAQDRGVSVVAEPGKPFGQIRGVKMVWIRDAEGNRLIHPNTGLPIRSSQVKIHDLGNALPDWLGGFANTFTYKGFRLYTLIDISQGGKVFSQSVREEVLYGTTKKTLPGREGDYVAEGVLAQVDANGNLMYTDDFTALGTGVRNTLQVRAQDYWNEVALDKETFVSAELLNDLSYIAMREISLSWTLPGRWLEKTFIRRATAGVYGRNLFYFQRKTDGFSPEACSFNVHNSSLGIESTSLPMMRVMGVNVSFEF
ncbi:MAG: SusC/RagA family TonB-linked outer membrane protein [Tannerella sp.]|nr:SusC/RagA family TonB-linked outer membrane protein [Tannerella sp.]